VLGADYPSSACCACACSEADEAPGNCVLAPVPGVVGTMMAVESLKFLAGVNAPAPMLRVYSGIGSEFRHPGISKRADCPLCA
jgi:molybdopterin-synthase adenylyltransferase